MNESQIDKRVRAAANTWLGTTRPFHPFRPFAPAADRQAYEQLPTDLAARLVAQGEARLGYDYPSIRATDYMRFKRTGDRAAYEAVYFGRRGVLSDLIQAECVEHKGRFLDDIINGIYAICEESAWQIPAHNSYIRDTPQLILPDVTRPVLDLFACETGALLACAAYLLQDELNDVSPYILTCIEDHLWRRIITPYLEMHFWWMGHDDEPMCNWTVWCTQNVLLTTFLMPWNQAPIQQEILLKAAESCDYFLKDYGDDGCCEEGAQYYRHAGLCLYGALSIMDAVTDGAFHALFSWPKVRAIAAYILHVHVADKYYFNFADCSPVAGRAGVREFLFGKVTAQEPLCLFAAQDFRAGGGQIVTDDVGVGNLYYRMQTVFHYNELYRYDISARVPHTNIYYPSVGLFMVHSDHLDLAVKVGDNNDSHNHNDTGSLTLYKDGHPVLADIGVETYSQRTFSPQRYEIWTMQSGYHNLPTIQGLDQHDGADYRAVDVQADPNGDTPTISMELATAYPLYDPSLQERPAAITYRRTVSLLPDENAVRLEDVTNASDVILNFITYDAPVTTTDPCLLQIGDAAFQWSGADLLVIETLPITDARLRTAWDHDLYRIRLQLRGQTFRLHIQ